MRTAPLDDLDRIRALADSLDCLLDDDVALLTGVTQGTTEAWRRRGQGPSYVMAGNRVLYPRAALAAFITSRIRERAPVAMKGEL